MHFTFRFLISALLLTALHPLDAQTVTRGPYLQKATPTSIVVRWRTDVPTTSKVGVRPAGTENYTLSVAAPPATTEHEVAITPLMPDTQYFYQVGDDTTWLATGDELTFFTAPPAGTVQPTRIWVLGDSGTADANAAAVRDGYSSFNGSHYTDVWLMLGDNAYNTGTDIEYQAAVFDMYPSFLRQTALWPTIGNHDTAYSSTPPADLPYFRTFTLPTAGEAGGEPSGTERYYSFDYAHIHFICLDSMSSDRSATGAMATWLRADLASTNQQWIVAYWHHPPYSKGSHNSDTESELIEMRENFLPILEAGGVDLVLAGHSHNYERSYFINGHYGPSPSFQETMKLNNGDGREDGGGAYRKPAGLPANQGAVYAVAGTSGKTSGWTDGSSGDMPQQGHPAMIVSLRRLGSVVIDVDGYRMDAKFLRETGAVDDAFTIIKDVPNERPNVRLTAPTPGSTLDGPATFDLIADAQDPDGTVAQVDFYAGDTLIGTATGAPFRVTWRDVAAGTHQLTATATDSRGATVTSAPITVTVRPPSRPPAPTGLAVKRASRSTVELTWTDSGANERGYKVFRWNGRTWVRVAIVAANVTSYTQPNPRPGAVYYFHVRAYNDFGNSPRSNVRAASVR
jgi:hypothetical protein